MTHGGVVTANGSQAFRRLVGPIGGLAIVAQTGEIALKVTGAPGAERRAATAADDFGCLTQHAMVAAIMVVLIAITNATAAIAAHASASESHWFMWSSRHWMGANVEP